MSEVRETRAENLSDTEKSAEDAEVADFGAQDPFEPHNLAISQFIMTARLLDVTYALLKEQNPDVARDILQLHSGGIVIGPQPSFSGTFLTDEMNGEDLEGVDDNEV